MLSVSHLEPRCFLYGRCTVTNPDAWLVPVATDALAPESREDPDYVLRPKTDTLVETGNPGCTLPSSVNLIGNHCAHTRAIYCVNESCITFADQ